MDQPPATSASLLIRLRDPADDDAWRQFVKLYAPMIYGLARKKGLQDADAADLMQDVFRAVANAMGKLDYDRERGTFRGWLHTVTRNKIFNFLEARRHRPAASGDSAVRDMLAETAAPDTEQQWWDEEYERRLFTMASDQVRDEFKPATWQAFWKTAVEARSVKEVSVELQLSPGAIYVAKSRVLARLREKISELREE